MKNLIIGLALLIIAGLGVYFITAQDPKEIDLGSDTEQDSETEENLDDTTAEESENDSDDNSIIDDSPVSIIGTSVEGREIVAYHYGNGDKEILFIGGIHGGYSWNTALLNYDLINYLNEQPEIVPENLKVTVIPVLNPDGLYEIAGTASDVAESDLNSIPKDDLVAGRFNTNDVDLNRNFDCQWESVGTWQNKEVSGGQAPFSEPESMAIKNYVESNNISAAVVYYSSAGGVFTSSCNGAVLAETSELTKLYADESGYKEYQEFDFYEITGDMVNWLAKKEIPAISVLLSQHNQVEWSKNLDAIKSVLDYYAE